MIWKLGYELGNELIDNQHKELFKRVEALNNIVESDDAAERKQECIDAILFLKEYAVNHFAAEEEFQESLNYSYLEFHKAIHGTFVANVLEAEKKLVKSDFSLPVIKEFCGFLSMWLIYHVAGADQKIVNDDVLTVAEFAIAVSYEDCVLESLKNVLDTVWGGTLNITKSDVEEMSGDAVRIDTKYDEKPPNGRIMRFKLSKTTALNIISSVTGLVLTEVDELAYAALEQLAKSVRTNIADYIGRQDDSTSVIESGEFFINTNFGHVSVALIDA